MAGPIPYRTHDTKYTPSFPPVVYYRDTFGLEKDYDGSDNDSIATKSTVRGTMNINAITGMEESTGSKFTNMTQSYHSAVIRIVSGQDFSTLLKTEFKWFRDLACDVGFYAGQTEQLTTTRIFTSNASRLIILSLVLLGSAVQLFIFSVIAVFYDGCPYYISLIIPLILISNSLVIFTFTKCRPTRAWLLSSCISSCLSIVLGVGLFLWTMHLANNEDGHIERLGAKENRLVTSTRLALYAFIMIFAAIHVFPSICAAYILCSRMRKSGNETVTRGYFLSQPQLGHQKILVPIELREIRNESDDDMDRMSIGVQTSGSQR